MITKLWSRINFVTIGAWGAGLLITSLLGFLIWYGSWVTTVDNYELGFVFDRVTGKIEPVEKQGWVIRTPIRYSVHTIDLRPYQVTISFNERVLNAKLVRFNPDGLATFVEWHGRDAGDSTTNLREILKCYAFDVADGKDCPFLEVIQEIAPNQGALPSSNITLKGEQ